MENPKPDCAFGMYVCQERIEFKISLDAENPILGTILRLKSELN